MKPILAITANTSWYIYNFRNNLITHLLQNDYDVVAISPGDQYSDSITKLGARHIHVKMDQNGKNPISDYLTYKSFKSIYSKVKPVIVLNFTPKNNIYSTLAAKECNIPAINNIAGLGNTFIENNLLSKITLGLYKYSQPKAHKVFFQNKDDLQLFSDHRIVCLGKCALLPGSGVDLCKYSPKPRVGDGTIRFILVSRMLREKGIFEYAQAATILTSEYSNLEFQLLGPTNSNNPSSLSPKEIEALELETPVKYLGASDNTSIEVANTDCVVLPSYYREGVPRSALEGAAMGKPVVTTDVVGCRETIDDGITGILCKPKNVDSLVSSLRRIIEMPPIERMEMGLRGREKMEKQFDERMVTELYHQAINSCLHTNS